jgi:hypothetical protein
VTSPRAVATVAVLAWATAIGGAACRQQAPPPTDQAVPVPQPVASRPPVPADHLAPGELVEGDREAFGVRLPRDLQIDGAFVDLVFASGRVAVHPLVTYLRARLSEGSLREGEESATFEHVHVPSRTITECTVRVWLSNGTTRVEFRDTTPRPTPNLPDEAARWRQAGLTPQGRPLDPTHLE